MEPITWDVHTWLYTETFRDYFMRKMEIIRANKEGPLEYTDFNTIDLIHPGLHEGIDKFITKHEVKPPAKVFEVGNGAGGTARRLYFKYGLEVDAVEYFPHFVECSSEINRIFDIEDKVRAQVGDITTFPLPENTFDIAFGILVFMHIEDIAGYRNVVNSLKPGGLFYLEDYYFIKNREDWDDNDRAIIEARGMCGVRSKEEYRKIFDEVGLDIIEESEFGYYFSEQVWSRAQKMVNDGIEYSTDPSSYYYQYVHLSSELSCDLSHLTVDEIKSRYPDVAKQFDIEDLVFHKIKLASNWRVVGRKR